MKLFKRLLLIAALFLAGMIVLAAIGFGLSRKRPAIYRPYVFDAARQQVINQKAVDKLLATRHLVATNWSQQVQAQRAGTTRPIQAEPRTVTFSEEELNAFLQHNFKDALASYVREPGIFLAPGKVVLAGEVPQAGASVLSFHFEPRIEENDQLRMNLANCYIGSARVPRSVFGSHLEKVRASIESRMPGWQKYAAFDRAGAANDAAAYAAMGKLVLSILDDTTADNVVFLADEGGRQLPLRLTDILIEAGSITLTIEATTADERKAILARLKSKDGEAATVPGQP